MSSQSKMSMNAANSAESSTKKPLHPQTSSMVAETVGAGLSLGIAKPTPTPRPQSRKVYICSLCGRIFPTYQGLGGHQNGHRKERVNQPVQYIRQRLETTTSILIAAVKMNGLFFKEPRRNRVNKSSHNGGGGDGGYHPYQKPHGGADEAMEGPSLELSLGIGGRRKKLHMACSFANVLLPACRNSKGLDLTLRL